jgi:hypothetical protein
MIFGLTGTLLAMNLALASPEARRLFLFADRSWALSGDTVWFTVADAWQDESRGNVVHVRLENHLSEPVSEIMVITKEGAGDGYMPVPDSLQTGIYWLRAYSSAKVNDSSSTSASSLLTVFHRFMEHMPAIHFPDGLEKLPTSGNGLAEMTVTQQVAAPRGRVTVDITIPEMAGSRIREMVVSARLEGPLDSLTEPFYLLPPALQEMQFRETLPPEVNGFFIEGRIKSVQNRALPDRMMVLLSIPDTIPYFDYFIAKDDGYFRFKLKDAYGTAQIYLRAIAADGQELSVELMHGMMIGGIIGTFSLVEPDQTQQKFVRDMTDAAWLERIFSGSKVFSEPVIKMEPRFKYAFYGIPDRRVVPSEFADLPDFMEISRELLPAVRFRQRDNQFLLQILDNQEGEFFEKSPLRLINGIPVFDDNLLFRLKSSDIRYMDIIYKERIYGDISFKGVLAIALKDGKDNFLEDQKSLHMYTIPSLQIYREAGYMSTPLHPSVSNIPDFRRVFLFRRVNAVESTSSIDFTVSDLKGTVVVKLQGITTDNQPFVLIRKIVVQ